MLQSPNEQRNRKDPMSRTVPQLPRAKRRRLIRLGRKSGDPNTANRFAAVAKLSEPRKPSKSQVARELAVAVSTVVAAARRWLLGGVEQLYDQRIHNGRARKIDDIFAEAVQTALFEVPQDRGWERPTWTRELLCLEMKRLGFPRVAVCTMGRLLASLGARLGSPKPVVLCPWPSRKRQRVIGEIDRLVDSACSREPVFYADEVDIHLNPKIGRDWMPRGFQRQIVTPGKNEKHYFAGALDALTDELVTVDAPRKNSLLFCELVERLVACRPNARRIHLVVDNYIIHSSKITRQFLERYGHRVVLHFLPPYCPDHNRIERVWQDLHANVTRNHRCPSMEELLRRVRAFVRAYNRRDRCNPSNRRAIRVAA
jgi:transposase